MSFHLKRGDLRPVFVVALKDDYGEATEAAVNLTSASTAVFNMQGPLPGSSMKITRSPCTITNAAQGEITFNWGTAGAGTAHTNTSGTYHAEIEVSWNDGKAETFPNSPSSGDDGTAYWQIVITDDLA